MKKFKFLALLAVIVAAIMFFQDGAFFPLVRTVYSLEKNMIFEKIMTTADSYERSETSYITVLYTPNDELFVPIIQTGIALYYEMIAIDFGLSDCDIFCVVYPDKQEMGGAIGVSYDTAPMGVYFGGVIHILSPTQWIYGNEAEVKSKFLKDGPIVHELVHMAVDIVTHGNYPVWLTEGIALYYENKYTGFEWRNDLSDASNSITYEELNKNFRTLDESLAYRRSYNIIDAFVANNSETALIQILYKLGEGAKIADFDFGA